MRFLERAQLFLAGMFLSLGMIYFEFVSDVGTAAFWVTGAIVLCWGIEATLKKREGLVGISVSADGAESG